MRIKTIVGTLFTVGVLTSGAFAQPLATPGTPDTLGPAGSVKPPGDSTAATPPGAISGSSVTGARISLDQLCRHTRLSDADKVDCSRRLGTATTEAQRLELRRTFEARAGLRAGSANTSGSSSTSGAAPSSPTSETSPPGSSGVLDGKPTTGSGDLRNLPPH